MSLLSKNILSIIKWWVRKVEIFIRIKVEDDYRIVEEVVSRGLGKLGERNEGFV